MLRARGVGWLEDASNASPRYVRNRLRHRVLPAIERELGRAGLDRLPELASRWRVEEDYLESETRRFAAFAIVDRRAPNGPTVDLTALQAAPAALRPRILRQWLLEVTDGKANSMAQLRALEDLVGTHAGSAEISIAGLRIVRSYETLRARSRSGLGEQPPFSYELSTDRRSVLEPPSGHWRIAVEPGAGERAALAATVYRSDVDVDGSRLPGGLRLRRVRPGDSVDCSPHRGHRKVYDIMVDNRVPRDLRDDWPVLMGDDRILWVPGLAIAPEIAATADIEQRIRLRWWRKHF
jgi:tRNA(Ile)-lysidine synthase